MQFNSYSYLACLAVAVAIFWLLPARFRRVYVLAASVTFYASWNIYFVPLPFLICGVMYISARRLKDQRAWLWVGIGTVVGLLAFFKYREFAWGAIRSVLQMPNEPVMLLAAIGLPLGISFYSFEAVSYLLDTRQGRVKPTSFLDACLFVMFWPHLIAGPIVRVRELIPQLRFDGRFEHRFVVEGMNRLILGLVQKNVLANSLGSWVEDGFLPRVARLNTTMDNWCLAVAFGLQIYFDFAAYSNLAIGAAQMIGVRLPENFRAPYHAWNPADFWSRWHMTLSRWIRDYLFFPLNSRFRGAPGPLYASLVGVMALVGLWHGAGWGFVTWGILHGLYLAAYRWYETEQQKRFPGLEGTIWVRLPWRALTLAGVAIAWIPFRASTLGQAWTMVSTMTWRWTPGFSYSVNFYLVTLLICAYCAAEPYFGRVIGWADGLVKGRSSLVVANAYLLRPLAYAAGLVLFMVFDDQDTAFIYFQF